MREIGGSKYRCLLSLSFVFEFPVYNCIYCTEQEGSPDGIEVRGVTVLIPLCPQIDVWPNSLIKSSLLESTPTANNARSGISLGAYSSFLRLRFIFLFTFS